MEKVELRMSEMSIVAKEDGMYVEGVVNKPTQFSKVLGQRKKFVETIEKGVFQRAIDKAEKIDFLAEHNPKMLLASTSNNSLEVREEDGEVRMSAKIAPTSYGKDYFVLMKEGLCNQMSFMFRCNKDRWEKGKDGIYKRYVEDMDIMEVTACRFGAYPQSELCARGLDLVEEPKFDEIEKTIEKQEQEKQQAEKSGIDIDALIERIAEKVVEQSTLVIEQKINELKEVIADLKPETEEVSEPDTNDVEEVEEVETTEEVQEPTIEKVEVVEEEHPKEEVDAETLSTVDVYKQQLSQLENEKEVLE